MLIGAMNHPAHDLLAEIRWMAEMGLDFIDLTLEPPAASCDLVDPRMVRGLLSDHGMQVVGHTAYYLPIGSPFEHVRRGAVAELIRCLECFAAVGVRWMNIHPHRYAPFHDRGYVVERNRQSLEELAAAGRKLGVGLMVENLPGEFNSAEQLADLLDPMPELGLHLDLGHANLRTPHNTTDSILERFGSRLRHVHLHDNKGGSDDLHLPLGAGTLNIRKALRALHQAGYDGTITLEVFTPDRQFLAYSRDVLRELWAECRPDSTMGK